MDSWNGAQRIMASTRLADIQTDDLLKISCVDSAMVKNGNGPAIPAITEYLNIQDRREALWRCCSDLQLPLLRQIHQAVLDEEHRTVFRAMDGPLRFAGQELDALEGLFIAGIKVAVMEYARLKLVSNHSALPDFFGRQRRPRRRELI